MVTIQQAAMNSLATWITSQMSGGVTVFSRWPSPDIALPPKAISIAMIGQASDTPFDRHLLRTVAASGNNVVGTWFVKSRRQPFQIDIWAQTDPDRDDLLAQLDNALNAGEFPLGSDQDPAGSGLLLQVADGWAQTFADFSFDGPSLNDSPESVQRSEYRATVTGNVYVQLTLDKTSVKQTLINISESSGLFNSSIT